MDLMQLVHRLKGIWKALAQPTQFSESHLAAKHTFLISRTENTHLLSLTGFWNYCEKYLLGTPSKSKGLISQSDVGNICLSNAVRTK